MNALCRLIFIIAMVVMLLMACAGLALVAAGERRVANVVIEYPQCAMRLDGYLIVWSPKQKNLPSDLRAAKCWKVRGKIDKETVLYYDMIGARFEVKR